MQSAIQSSFRLFAPTMAGRWQKVVSIPRKPHPIRRPWFELRLVDSWVACSPQLVLVLFGSENAFYRIASRIPPILKPSFITETAILVTPFRNLRLTRIGVE
jgi:hypothetical protein